VMPLRTTGRDEGFPSRLGPAERSFCAALTHPT
jgi:hypothetical protein